MSKLSLEQTEEKNAHISGNLRNQVDAIFRRINENGSKQDIVTVPLNIAFAIFWLKTIS